MGGTVVPITTTPELHLYFVAQDITQYFALDWLTFEKIAHVSFRLMHLNI